MAAGALSVLMVWMADMLRIWWCAVRAAAVAVRRARSMEGKVSVVCVSMAPEAGERRQTIRTLRTAMPTQPPGPPGSSPADAAQGCDGAPVPVRVAVRVRPLSSREQVCSTKRHQHQKRERIATLTSLSALDEAGQEVRQGLQGPRADPARHGSHIHL